MICAACHDQLPDGAAFCVECGAPVRPAVTGPTQRLSEPPQPRYVSREEYNGILRDFRTLVVFDMEHVNAVAVYLLGQQIICEEPECHISP